MKSTKRKFILGSEWIYYKIYSGLKTQQSILKNEVMSIVLQLYEENKIDKFFYIRYTDEDGYHLRLRFHVLDSRHIANVLNLVYITFKQLIDTRIVHNVSLGTYNREMERYGTGNIEDVETLFSKNSMQVLDILTESSEREDMVWQKILPVVDEILTSSGFNDYRKYLVMEDMYQYYLKQFGPNNRNELKLQQRNNKKIVEQSLVAIGYPRGVNPINIKSSYIPELQRIVSRYDHDLDNLELQNLVKGLIHMAFNRFFLTNQNKYELVVYYMLSHYYRSCFIRKERRVV